MREFGWLVAARGMWAGFLALAALLAWLHHSLESAWPLFALCAAMGAYDVVGALATSRHPERMRRIALATLFLDLIAFTAYLHYSGDIENPFEEWYFLPVIAGSVIVSKRAGYLLAGVATILFALMVAMTAYDAMPVHLQHHHLSLIQSVNIHEEVDPDTSPGGSVYIVSHLIALLVLLYGLAFGFGSLAERIREKELQLARENERLDLLMRTLPVGVALVERDGTVRMANPASRALLGEVAGRPLASIAGCAGVAERLAQIGTEAATFETANEGRVLEHSLARASVEGPIVWVFRDMTDQRRLMAHLMHSSKMAALGLLAAGIAHEIGNPLSSMSAILQILRMRPEANDVPDRLRALGGLVERIDRIVRDVIGFARPSPRERVRVTAQEVVEGALQVFRLHDKGKRVRLEVALPEEPIVTDGVKDQLVQVVLNFLLNAADALGEGGTIRVGARAREGEMEIWVADDGRGIAAGDRGHLFEPFFTTKDPGQGVGLGLFVSDSIVRAHDGRIEVESAPGRGSTFRVVLPSAREEAATWRG